MKIRFHRAASFAVAIAASLPAIASSHREAPLITQSPKLDCTDFYMFNSYEAGREGYVTIVANYIPLQDSYGGPNYFSMDPEALYEIHIDNNGDNVEDITFQFRFNNSSPNIAIPIGKPGEEKMVAVPLLAVGPITKDDQSALNYEQTYTLNVIRGARRTGTASPVMNTVGGSTTFTKPMDNVGNRTFPDYAAYANQYMYSVNLPGGDAPARLFVGQRKDPFVVNLGETFDLVGISTSPLGPENANKDSLADKNVTAMILEVPKSFLKSAADKPIIGAWATASKITKTPGGGSETNQVSRLSAPLVNEVVIGYKDKDKFNASEPKDDLANFADYVLYPTLPKILEIIYGGAGVKAPTAFPRLDLANAFVFGLDGLNKNGGTSEMLRLNTGTPTVAAADQKNMGALAGDISGFPNGRRPGDDVVDIALRVVMGALLPEADAPSGKLPFTDGATVNASMFKQTFPYLNDPIPGSPNDPSVVVTLQQATALGAPFKSVPARDAGNGKIATAKPDGNAIYRLKSDSNVQPGAVSTQGNEVLIGVKR